MHAMRGVWIVSVLMIHCGGDGGDNGSADREAPGLVVSNASPYTVSQIFVRTCGAKPWSTELSHPVSTPPNGTTTLGLPAGCYDVVAVAENADAVLHRHAPGMQVTAGDATPLTLATPEFQAPDASVACAATEEADGAVYVVGNAVVMDQMLDPVADAYMRQEFARQTAFFNIGANTVFLGLMDSQGPNAMASNLGFIAFGDAMYQIHGSAHGGAGLISTLAHEYGHRVQQTLGFFGEDPDYFLYGQSVVVIELEADAFAGYYMAHPFGANVGEAELAAMFNHFYSIGSDDFMFYEPQWHGTRYQRYASNYIGAQTAYLAYQSGYNYTYQELHDLWLYTIITDIMRNPSPALRQARPRLTGKALEAYSRLRRDKIRDLARGDGRW